ncbi:GntR family transcriptional regulator [Streptomyces sp. NPDC051567]|uniref:GntR family transcriptional regulator n=1 Tax=Streptomyces sp. NPDC051567 TaxID=3365660 RepID=UPI0037A44EE5
MEGRRKGREGGYGQIAAHFRALISSGELAPGDALPSMRAVCEQFGTTIVTANRAYRLLQEEGLTTSKSGVGTVVRSWSRVRIPFSVYESAMAPGDKGPWERATAAQGLDGRMSVQPPERTIAPADIAQALGVEPGASVIFRRRRAMIGDEVIQIQDAWYPVDIARTAGLDTSGKITGGILAAMTTVGLLPTEADHRVTVWVPTSEQATELSLGSRVSVLVVERVTRDQEGRVLEVARITGAADRMELVYERLPLTSRTS